MSYLTQDDDLETDNAATDWSLMNSRLASFRGSSLAQQLPAERLARAGFYFTGHADRVRCFSCQKTVENWCGEDMPVERHKEVSPSCKFLRCTHRSNVNPDSLTNGSTYNEELEDMEFRLRTGEVFDQTPYPKAPHMISEDSRLATFTSWPSTAPVRPRDLAEAGLYYLGDEDKVQCFCCGNMLAGWETGDTAWGEHSKHFPRCFFILGHDVGNIPSLRGVEVEEGGISQRTSPAVPMSSYEDRLMSFEGVQHLIHHDRLAAAGFYSRGVRDMVVCFCCGGGLKGWQPEEDPWEEHAKHYPGCSFLLTEKGQEFVNSVQLQHPRRNGATPGHQNGFSSHQNDVLQSEMAQKALEMGLDPIVIERTIQEKMSRTGSGYPNLEAFIHDCLNPNPESNTQSQDEDPLEKLRELQREKQCKICMDRDICIVFIPCGHLFTCKECAEALNKCPICCGAITQKIKTYIA